MREVLDLSAKTKRLVHWAQPFGVLWFCGVRAPKAPLIRPDHQETHSACETKRADH